ncbi:metal ABC transporter ATP-binding protein [Candidatus Latescibacterota bacterium]
MTDSHDIELRNVRFSYNSSLILQDIDLTVARNDFLVIIGPNGGGKTTLVKLMLGLLTPDSGTVSVFGERPSNSAYRIGYVSQDVLIRKEFPLTVQDVVLMGRMRYRNRVRRHTRDDLLAVEHALETAEILDFRSDRVNDLSGGQRQRVSIARALATEPDILVLDEPTASIDMQGQSKVYEILKELNDRMTIIVVSHDFVLTLGFAKTVAHVNKTAHVHKSLDFTPEMLSRLTESSLKHICPVELITQGYLQIKSLSDEGGNHD